jgi:hypothetical protein
MARETSVSTYLDIINNGRLTELREECYRALYAYGPASANELIKMAASDKSFVGMSNIPKRLSELRRCGVAYEVCKRKCKVTGREVIIWDTTDSLPVDYEKPETKKDKIESAINELRKLYVKINNNKYEK